MDRERLDNWLEKGILWLVLAILIFGPLATGAVRTLELLVIQGLTTLVLLLWIARFWINRQYRLIWPPICWAVLLFVGYAVMRYLQADIEYVARKELNKVLIYAFLFFLILNNLHRQESTQAVTMVLIFLALGISVYAIYQFITNSDKVWHFTKPAQYMKRGSGTYICPNHLAGFLEMILPLGLAYTLTGRLRPATRVLLGYASLVILAGIGVSISRGGWIATGITLIVFFSVLISHRDYRTQALVCLVVLMAAGTVFVMKAPKTQDRFREMLVGGKIEDIRFKLWKPALIMWKENIWLGVGPAHFDFRWRQYRPEDVQMRGDRVHNDYLNTLVDWGIAGAMVVALPWGLLAWGIFKTWRYVRRSPNDFAAKKSNKSAFVLGAASGLLAILLHSFVDFNMHIPANAILAITLMALLSAHLRFATERYWLTLGWSGKTFGTLFILLGVAWFALQGMRRYEEYKWLRLAGLEKELAPERLEPLKKALTAEPKNFQTAYEIGEVLRMQSWEGNDGYKDLATQAMSWFDRSIKLNPYDGYSYLRYGMCLDWLDQTPKATPYFNRASELDPNGYYTVAHQGWHCFNLGDYQTAKSWFERSLQLKPKDNPSQLATSYLRIINRKLAEADTDPGRK
jgi:O-antigen ligase